MKIQIFILLCIIFFKYSNLSVIYSDDTDVCADVEQNDDEATYLPVPGDCTKYIECYNHEGSIMQCPQGEWWHQEILNCDYPGDYCDNSTTTTSKPTSISTTTSKSPTSSKPPKPGPDPRCTDNGSNYWPHPAYCARYIECHEGSSYEMACPPGLYFSESKKKCVNPEESECCIASSQC